MQFCRVTQINIQQIGLDAYVNKRSINNCNKPQQKSLHFAWQNVFFMHLD